MHRIPVRAGLLLALAPCAALAGSPRDLSFTVDVSVTERAAAELASRGMTLRLAAAFYGEPTWANRKNTALDGQVNLGRQEVALPPEGGTARINGARMAPERLALIKGDALVNIEVYSVAAEGPDNILDCGLVEGRISRAALAPHRLSCRLIGERG